jgi:sulfite reductase alpha subunit-like flavoprotein
VLVSEVTTLREAALRLFDLQAIPGRYFFELLSKFTKDDLEKEKFKEFTTAEGQQDLYEYCNRPRRNGLEVLNDFSLNTVPNIPMEYLFDLFPVIKPRSFSIANSLKSVENVVQLLVAVVKYRSKLVDPRIGLCSNWLTGLAADKDQQQKVPIWIKKGTLKFPTNDPKIPIVMVGPGTGVAPFRSIITDELEQGSKRPMVLIFGNRNKDKDFYFKAEWDKLQSNHDNFKLFTAFSRDQEDKYYVQDVIKANKGQISDWICNGQGIFYIAGNAKQMPDQVKDALKEAIQSLDEDKTDEDFNVNKYLSQMEAEKRFQTETWS